MNSLVILGFVLVCFFSANYWYGNKNLNITANLWENNNNENKYNNLGQPDGEIRPCSQQERLKHVHKICDKYRGTLSADVLKPEPRSIVDPKHKLMMTWMSKGGGTSFKALLLEAAGFKDETNHDPNMLYVHNERRFREYNMTMFKNLNDSDQNEVMKTYFTFMLTRHPLERLLSTYRGKVERPSDLDWFAAKTLKMLYPDKFEQNKTLKAMWDPQTVLGIPRFEEFLTWIIRSKTHNEHWNPLIDELHPCSANWSAILRLETMHKDGDILLEHLRPDVPYTHIPVRHSHQNVSVQDHFQKTLDVFADVPDDVLDYFLDLYALDMEMFGYHWDKSTHTAYCGIDTDLGVCC